ncbi:MAG: DUF2975 domain-containing protein [Clostridia bacterium]|nr:DUF2975 domain-containing protein [Clostridia bacterium]
MTKKVSAYISLAICAIAAICLILLLFFFPEVFRWLITKSGSAEDYINRTVKYVTTAFYIAAPFAAAALYILIRMLINIIRDRVFVKVNVIYLNLLSLCCFGAAIVCAIYTRYYTSLGAVAFVLAVVGILLRVVMNAIGAAVELKRENDLTI